MFNFDINSAIAQQGQGFNALGELGRFMLQQSGQRAQQGQQAYMNRVADAERARLDAERKRQQDEQERIRQIIMGAQTKTVETPYTEEVDESVQYPDISAFMQGMGGTNLSSRDLNATTPAPAEGKPWDSPFLRSLQSPQDQTVPPLLAQDMTGQKPVEPVKWELPLAPAEVMKRTVTKTRTEQVPNENWMGDVAGQVAAIDPELGLRFAQGAKVEQGQRKADQLNAATESVNESLNSMYQPMPEGLDEAGQKGEMDRRFVKYVTEMNKYNALAGKPLVDVNSIEMQKQKQDTWRYQIDNQLEMTKQRAINQKAKEDADLKMREEELNLKRQQLAHEKAMDYSNLGLEKQKLEAAKATGKYNDGQLNSAAFAVRMSKAIPVVIENESRLTGEDRTLLALGQSPVSDSGRLYYNALRDVAMAQLRKESGAAISDGEMKLMFDRYGRSLMDGDSVRAQKIEALKTDLENMKALSNGAYEFITSKQQGGQAEPNAGKPTNPPAPPPNNRRKRIPIDDNAEF